jgi:hypothetical protein
MRHLEQCRGLSLFRQVLLKNDVALPHLLLFRLNRMNHILVEVELIIKAIVKSKSYVLRFPVTITIKGYFPASMGIFSKSWNFDSIT